MTLTAQSFREETKMSTNPKQPRRLGYICPEMSLEKFQELFPVNDEDKKSLIGGRQGQYPENYNVRWQGVSPYASIARAYPGSRFPFKYQWKDPEDRSKGRQVVIPNYLTVVAVTESESLPPIPSRWEVKHGPHVVAFIYYGDEGLTLEANKAENVQFLRGYDLGENRVRVIG